MQGLNLAAAVRTPVIIHTLQWKLPAGITDILQ